ncbi:hypothetical protein A9Q81_13240 [Gammaproteobacteria bacterium 42_54_T18]|nr:hypothetical protein A9Q81_13240 [Gammaproteobacteria bacterium 42_54_T18]
MSCCFDSLADVKDWYEKSQYSNWIWHNSFVKEELFEFVLTYGCAFRNEKLMVVQFLIEQGIDVDTVNIDVNPCKSATIREEAEKFLNLHHPSLTQYVRDSSLPINVWFLNILSSLDVMPGHNEEANVITIPKGNSITGVDIDFEFPSYFLAMVK